MESTHGLTFSVTRAFSSVNCILPDCLEVAHCVDSPLEWLRDGVRACHMTTRMFIPSAPPAEHMVCLAQCATCIIGLVQCAR